MLIRHVKTARDDILIRCADPDIHSESLELLKACIINCWNKLDFYFTKCDSTGAVYATVITQPKSKFYYFETRWENELAWVDKAKGALFRIWAEYKNLNLDNTSIAGEVICWLYLPCRRAKESKDEVLGMWMQDVTLCMVLNEL
ncbi:hypothetical protein IFR05_014439 [Cadophora sp. M221]|nr:hypothetical protein IFR05_014439 [Cadophora sp. M221]